MKNIDLTRVMAGIASALTGGIGVFTLVAWGLDRWEMVTLGSDYIPMAPITALLFALLAAAVAARLWMAERRAAMVAVHGGLVVAALVAVAELIRWMWPMALPWDHWGFGVETGFGVIQIGRMAPLTAAVFISSIVAFVGSGSAFASFRWVRYPANLAAIAGLLVGSTVILAYTAGTPLGYGHGAVPMAWLTATTFLVLNAGILAENGAGGLFRVRPMGEGVAEESKSASRFYRTQLLLVLVAVFVTGGLVGFYYLRQERAAIRQSVHEQLEAISNLKTGQIQQWRRERISDARLMAAMPALAASIESLARDPAGSAALRASLGDYLRTMAQAYGYRQVILFDRNFTPVLIASEEPTEDRFLAAELQAQIREAREPLMNDLHRAGAGRIHLDLIAPVRMRDGDQFAGAVQLTVDASVLLYPLVEEWPSSSDSGETLLFRQDGAEVVYLNELRHQAGSALELRSPVDSPTLLAARAVRSNATGLLEGTDYRGIPVLGVVRRVAGTPWFLLAKVDQVEAYSAIRAELVTVLTGVFLIAGMVGLFLRGIWHERQRQLTYQQLQLERSSRATSERLAHVMQHAGEVILLFDESMRIVEANQRAQEVYGRTPAEMTQLSARDLRTPESASRIEADFSKALADPGHTFESTHVRKDGSTFPVEVSARPVTIDGRQYVLSIIRDISLRKMQDEEISRLSRLYYVISQINKILLRVKNQQELFTEVCEVLVKMGGFRIAWVGWLDEATGLLLPVAVAGDEHGYVNGIRVSVDPSVPEGRGPSGTACREGRIVVCNDYFKDSSTQPWRERAIQSGFRSSIALPFQTEGRTVGLLAVYSGETNFFAPREVELLEETVDNMAFALEVFAQETRREAVDAERRKLSLAVEQSPTSIVITDLDGNMEYVNPRFTEVTGYTMDEVRGQNPRMLKSGLTAPAVYDDLWRTITRGEQWRGEIINRKKNGETHIELVLIAPVQNAAGEATHYIALKEDITERKRVEAALVASEAKFRRLFAMVPLPMGHSDANGVITFANERFYRTFGYEPGEVPTVQAWWERAYPDPLYRALLAEKWAAGVRKAAAHNGEIAPLESMVTCKNGQVRTVEISGMLVGGEMLVTFVDISERVKADKRLRQLSRIIEQAPLSIAITDLDGAIDYVNPTFLHVTGYAEAEVLGQNPRVLKSGLTPVDTYTQMWATLGRGEIWRGELSNKKKNGEIYHERVVIAPVADETGRPTHYVALKEDVTDRKQIEDELRQSNERFRAMFESNLDGLLITVPTGEIVAANPAACAILGRSEAEICRLGRQGLVAPEDPRTSRLLEERRLTGKARGIITMVRGDGTRFEAEISSAIFGKGAQQRNGLVLRDITDRIKAEEALRESEARFRELFDLESDAILVFTVDTGRIIQANHAAALLYGMPMERLLTLTTADISAEADATMATRLQISSRTDQILRIPLRFHRRSDGTIFPVEINLRSFRRGDQPLAVGVIRDITEQTRAQDQMRRFNEELESKVALRTEEIVSANNEMQALLQSIPDMVMRVNRSGTVLNYQPAKGATPLATIPPADVIESGGGTTVEALRALVRLVGEKTLAGNAAVVEEHELSMPSGPVAVELRAAPVSQDDFVVFARDVTARKHFEAEMAAMLEKEHQVSAMKTRFISVTSHEFRTPMAAALGSVELLTNHLDRLAPAKRQELLARITQSLLRMTEMLDEILLLNRMDANRVEMRLAPVDLLLFARNLVEEIRLGDRAGHVIELECTGVTAGFVTDTNLLHHILGNILSNAVRYSPAGTRILARLNVENSTMCFTVEDQGIGIPAEDLQRIFEPFERGSNVGNIKGTGLGLNIVKRMVEMLRGEISVRSVATGSCFTVTLPSQTNPPIAS